MANIQSITKLELQGAQLANLPTHDARTLARANRALKKAHKTGDMVAFERAARAFSELGIHFRVYG